MFTVPSYLLFLHIFGNTVPGRQYFSNSSQWCRALQYGYHQQSSGDLTFCSCTAVVNLMTGQNTEWQNDIQKYTRTERCTYRMMHKGLNTEKLQKGCTHRKTYRRKTLLKRYTNKITHTERQPTFKKTCLWLKFIFYSLKTIQRVFFRWWSRCFSWVWRYNSFIPSGNRERITTVDSVDSEFKTTFCNISKIKSW